MTQRQLIPALLIATAATMAYPLTKLAGHEWAAYALTVLLFIHLYLARTRLPQLFRRRQAPALRIYSSANLLFLAVTVICFLSGFAFSSLIPHPGREFLRWCKYIHICSAAWWYLLLGVHLGLYRHVFRRFLRQLPARAVRLALGAMTAYGLYIAGARNFYLKLAALYLKHPKPEPSALLFFWDYLCILLAFAVLTAILHDRGLRSITRKRQ